MARRGIARLYPWWLRTAEKIQTVVVTVLFGVCYLFVVPFFSLILLVRAALRSGTRVEQSDWINLPPEDATVESFQRMG